MKGKGKRESKRALFIEEVHVVGIDKSEVDGEDGEDDNCSRLHRVMRSESQHPSGS